MATKRNSEDASARSSGEALRGLFGHHEPPSGVPSKPNGGSIDLLAGLNPAQREAVLHETGPLFILAGPGSGKTRVITRRIAWLCRERGVDPWRILAITFTNKAAREMRERVEAILPVRGLWISTFHSLCARILRREIEILPGYTRDFTIYDTNDKNQLLKQLLKDSDYDVTRFKPAMVGAWISDWKNGLDRTRDADLEDAESIEGELFSKMKRRYTEALRKHNALDFDDLLVKVHEIFEEHPGVRDSYASRFVHVMVDEYQDTNHVQYRLTKSLASIHGNVAVCGDPDQSIYGWRGADIRNILDFEQDFPSPRVVKLEQNYRSTMAILKAAQAVIEKNFDRKSKSLWSEKGEGRKIVSLTCADENDEAREIALQIQALQREGRSPRHIAVFYRVNFMQRALESALRLARVPYQIIGGQEFYERREIRDLVSYAKLVVNPADDVAFRRVVNVPSRGIGDKSIETLSEFAADRRITLRDAARSTEALSRIRGRGRAGIAEFTALMDGLADLKDQPAAFALEQILEAIGTERWLAEMADDKDVDRQSNVDELVTFAESYDQMVEASRLAADPARGTEALEGGLRGFLQDIALVSDTDALVDDTDKVTLMTLHSAKGLEFPVVFIAGLEEELLPHARAMQDMSGQRPGSAIEEERRLFYVGITRAEERLFLLHANQRMFFGEFGFRTPSRFLGEIPPDVIEGYEPDRDEEEMLGVYDKADAVEALAVGDRVSHEHFGRGTIDRLQGAGVNARATVRFPAHGTKVLLLQYAKLTRIAQDSR
ncbi:MAG: UvrD-helicase domain-containing protein [Planctomycetes bacterium]|nr:UvrD-helicase domain-containing protein [Planctomycetota bacterium]